MEEKKERSALELLAEGRNKVSQEKDDAVIPAKHGPDRKKVKFLAVIFLFLMFLSVATAFAGSGKNNEEMDPEVKIDTFEELMRGRLNGDIRSAMNIKRRGGSADIDEDKDTGKTKAKNISSSAPVKSKNAEKDREIIENYAKLTDAAAESGHSGTRRRFRPGGDGEGGGVFIKKHENGNENKSALLELHDIKVKVRLEFSIRSTAPSTVVATVVEGNENIPRDSRFYGAAEGFVNKRTRVSFSKLMIREKEFRVKGFAVSGKDPGIESEVTDISEENIKSDIKQGLTKTTGVLISGLAGGAGKTAGTAAANTVAPAVSEIEKQEEAGRMKQEYRVPAGTSFFVYLE